VRRGYLVAVECLGAPKWSGRKCSTGRNRSSGSLRPNSRQASLSQQPLRHGLAGALSRSLLSFHSSSLGVNSCSPLRSLVLTRDGDETFGKVQSAQPLAHHMK
jgi:hypothetical protein